MDVQIRECHRKNLCVDCDNKTCWHAGELIADCPMWKCNREGELFEDCESCAFLKRIHAEGRRSTIWRGDGMKKDYIVELREEEADELMDDHWVGELVRCKNCNNHDSCEMADRFGEDPEWFCADGEPKSTI